MNNTRRQNGFTLIEMLVYLGLFALIMSGTFAGAFQLIEHSNRTRTRVIQNEEAQFVFRKIDWVLRTATEIQEPDTGESGEVLVVEGSYGTMRFNQEEGVVLLNDRPLSSNRVVVDSFFVTRDKALQTVLSIDGVIATSTSYMYE